jgi:hypothetical protein
MFKLLRFEYLLNRRQVVIIMGIFTAYFAFMASRIDSPRAFIVLTSLMIGLSMPFIFLGREDKFKTAALVCSLPVRRSTVVTAKYAAAWTAIGAGAVYAVLFIALCPFAKFSIGELLTARNLTAGLCLISLFLAVILPFTLRFGLSGVIVLLVGTQLLGVLLFALIQIPGGPTRRIALVLRGIEGALRALMTGEATPLFLSVCLAAVAAVNLLSLLLSRALYARRDL